MATLKTIPAYATRKKCASCGSRRLSRLSGFPYCADCDGHPDLEGAGYEGRGVNGFNDHGWHYRMMRMVHALRERLHADGVPTCDLPRSISE